MRANADDTSSAVESPTTTGPPAAHHTETPARRVRTSCAATPSVTSRRTDAPAAARNSPHFHRCTTGGAVAPTSADHWDAVRASSTVTSVADGVSARGRHGPPTRIGRRRDGLTSLDVAEALQV